jgi:hypothetical protein
MAEAPRLILTIKINCEISLWQAIKMRIAGEPVRTVMNEIANECKRVVENEIKR